MGVKIEDKVQLRPFRQLAGLYKCAKLRKTACLLDLAQQKTLTLG